MDVENSLSTIFIVIYKSIPNGLCFFHILDKIEWELGTNPLKVWLKHDPRFEKSV